MTEEIHTETQEVIDTFTFENFQGCMKSWETRPGGLLQRRWWKLRVTARNFFLMVKFPEYLGSPK